MNPDVPIFSPCGSHFKASHVTQARNNFNEAQGSQRCAVLEKNSKGCPTKARLHLGVGGNFSWPQLLHDLHVANTELFGLRVLRPRDFSVLRM
jgi:hypothetical protein